MATATQSFEPRVTLRELQVVVLEGRAMLSVDEFIDGFIGDRGLIGLDWKHELSVPIKTAAEIVNRHLYGKAEAARLREGYELYLHERNVTRDDAARKAFEIEARVRRLDPEKDFRLPGAPLGSPTVGGNMPAGPTLEEREAAREARENANAAADDARKKFDQRTPELSYEDWTRKRGNRKAA